MNPNAALLMVMEGIGATAFSLGEAGLQLSGYTNVPLAIAFGIGSASCFAALAWSYFLQPKAGVWQWRFEREGESYRFTPESRWPYARLISLPDATRAYPKIHNRVDVQVQQRLQHGLDGSGAEHIPGLVAKMLFAKPRTEFPLDGRGAASSVLERIPTGGLNAFEFSHDARFLCVPYRKGKDGTEVPAWVDLAMRRSDFRRRLRELSQSATALASA